MMRMKEWNGDVKSYFDAEHSKKRRTPIAEKEGEQPKDSEFHKDDAGEPIKSRKM